MAAKVPFMPHAQSPGETPSAPASSGVMPRPYQLSVAVLLLGAAAGGILGGMLSHSYFGTVAMEDMSEAFKEEAERIWPSLEFSAEANAEKALKTRQHQLNNAYLGLGPAGAAVGGLIGLAAGLSRKSLRAMLTGLTVGVIAAVVGGLAAGFAGVEVAGRLERYRIVAYDPVELTSAGIREMYLGSTVQAAEWFLISLGTGLAVVLSGGSAKSFGRVAGFAVLGALAGTICYTPVASAFFSAHGADSMVFPRGLAKQLTFVLLPSLGMALTIPRADDPPRNRQT